MKLPVPACAAFFLVLAALAAPAAPPNSAEKSLAVSIATAASPAEAAASHKPEWTPGLAGALVSEGIAREANPDISEALYRVALDIARQTGDNTAEASSMYELGTLLRARRFEFAESASLLRKALALQLADPSLTIPAADTAISLTLTLSNSGQIEAAVEASAQAIDIAVSSGDELRMGRAWSAAGSAATLSGNHRASIAFLQKALAVAQKQNSIGGQAAVLNNLGVACRDVYDYDCAERYFQQSLEFKRRQSGPLARISSAYLNLGELSLARKRLDEADRYFHLTLDAVQMPQDSGVRIGATINLGLTAKERGDFARALDYEVQAANMSEQAGDSRQFLYGHLFAADVDVLLHKPADAQGHLDTIAGKAAEAGDHYLLMLVTLSEGDVCREQGLIDRAREKYLSAIKQYEDLRLDVAGDESTQADFSDNSKHVYTSLIALEASSGRTADAFRYTELSKSRVLLDVFTSGRAEMARVLTPEESRRNSELLSRLADLNSRQRSAKGAALKTANSQMEQLRFDYANFRTGVYAAHPELALRRADPAPISPARAAALLPDEHTALISYSVGADSTWVFVIFRAGGRPVLRAHELKISEGRMAARVESFREQIAGRELGFAAMAGELYATLLKPLERDLPAGVNRLVISPDAPLWQVPFEALQDAGGRFVAESREVFYVPSATVLDRMRQVSAHLPAGSSLLALGDPSGDLPEAYAEVQSIAKLYSPANSKVLTGGAATEAALRANAGNYSVIHLAAHGMYDDSRPLFSYLALAPSPASKNAANDGNIETREIMDLHLRARLVVLSGCETARSSGSGLGVAGMSWAVFIAGTPTTVASLWKVDSQSTAELMMTLHKGLTQKESPSKALREAKLSLMKNPAYRHPFYWAGIIGIGAGI